MPEPYPGAAGKTHAELAALEAGIMDQLDAGAAADPEYWAAVLRRLGLHKAKARLRHLGRVVLAGDGVDVGAAMGWDAEREARAPAAMPPVPLMWSWRFQVALRAGG